jgi:hypothetical protein
MAKTRKPPNRKKIYNEAANALGTPAQSPTGGCWYTTRFCLVCNMLIATNGREEWCPWCFKPEEPKP